MTVKTSIPNTSSNTLVTLPNTAIEPPPITQWPIAPGYWLVSGLLLAAITLLCMRYRKTLWRRQALTELNAIYQEYLINTDPYDYCKQANALLKRVALTRFPQASVAPLSGAAWLDFLDSCCVKVHFSDHFQWFATLPYQESLSTSELSVLTLHKSIKRWIKHHKVKPTRTNSSHINQPQTTSMTATQRDSHRQLQDSRHTLLQGATS
jgi:hypothetical protein